MLKKPSYPQTKQWEKQCVKTRRNLWLRRRRLKMFGIQKSAKVLEIACGDGLNIIVLKKMGIKNVIGLDISTHLLKLAKKNNPQTKFVLAPANNMPFKNASFNTILIDSALYHLDQDPKNLAEAKRVLKKNGFLCFSEAHNSWLRHVLNKATTSPLAGKLPFLKGRKPAYLAEKQSIENWLEREKAFGGKLEKEGFIKIFQRVDLLSLVGKYKKA